MRWINSLFVGIGVLSVVGCEDRDELDVTQKRIKELEFREEKLNGELEGIVQQANAIQEASRVAEESSLKEQEELVKEFRKRLAVLEFKSTKVLNEEGDLELMIARLGEWNKDYDEWEESMVDKRRMMKLYSEIHPYYGIDVEPQPLVRRLDEMLKEFSLREKELKEEVSRFKAKLGE